MKVHKMISIHKHQRGGEKFAERDNESSICSRDETAGHPRTIEDTMMSSIVWE